MDAVEFLLQQLIAGLAVGALYALVALGFTILWNAGNVVNFGQGEFATLTMFFLFTFVSFLNLPVVVAVVLAIAAIALVGAITERTVIRPVIGREPHTVILVTIGLQILLANVAKLIWGARPLVVEPFLGSQALVLGGVRVRAEDFWILVVVLVLVAGLHQFSVRTTWGKAFRAITEDREAAWLMGINVRRAMAVIFAVSAALAGVAGVLLAPIVYVSAELGLTVLIRAFAAAVIGGFGSYPGALVGGLLIGVLDTIGAVYISSLYRDLLTFAVLAIVLVARPSGLMRSARPAEQKA